MGLGSPAALTLLGLLAASMVAAQAPDVAGEPDVRLDGSLIGGQHHQTYQELPFDVPAGVDSLRVEFSYDRSERTTIDLGLFDPAGFRGWSGGNKMAFEVGTEWATPSYLPGPMPAGQWLLVLGVPNLRQDHTASYEAKIYFRRTPAGRTTESGEQDSRETADSPVRTAATASSETRSSPPNGPRWYRGDLHLHSGHSDGSCAVDGARAPCPLRRTLEVARERGLDFVAVTEHNTTSHYGQLAQLASEFPDVLLIPGREITTFYGHLNVYGTTEFLDFALGSERMPTLDGLLDRVEDAGGLVSINHPRLPSGEACMGCGWSVPETPYDRIQAVEVINGGAMKVRGNRSDGLFSGIPFWTERLSEGFPLVAIGGSDNHDPDLAPAEASAIGRPTTVVRAQSLSTEAILAGIRSGRVLVALDDDHEASKVRLDLAAVANAEQALVGETLLVRAGDSIKVVIDVVRAAGQRLRLITEGVGHWSPEGMDAPITEAVDRLQFEGRVAPDFGEGEISNGWLRAEVRNGEGDLVLLSNAISLRVLSSGETHQRD